MFQTLTRSAWCRGRSHDRAAQSAGGADLTRPVLPPRAKTALQLLSDGYKIGEIAGLMGVGSTGVSSALATARKNLGVSSTYAAVAVALRRKIID